MELHVRRFQGRCPVRLAAQGQETSQATAALSAFRLLAASGVETSISTAALSTPRLLFAAEFVFSSGTASLSTSGMEMRPAAPDREFFVFSDPRIFSVYAESRLMEVHNDL